MELTRILFLKEVSEIKVEFSVTQEEKGGATVPELLAVESPMVL